MGDYENLETYAASGCEEAFRELVEKYANLVFSAALRRTLGNRELAEEVAQNVFAIMARKARRRGWIEPQALAPWLHRTAVLESANARRKEKRRRLGLERLANETMTNLADDNPQPAIDELDDAIDALSDGDRAVLMMHYFQGLSYREVAQATGKSEAASRKQASRALEKLGRTLGRKGIALSVAAIGSLLTAKLAEAAPAASGKVLAGSALASATSVSKLTIIQNTLNTMAYAKTKTAVAVAIIALVPLVSQWQRNRELGGRLTDLESRLDLGAGNQEEESSAGSPATLVTKRSLVGRSAGHDREGTDARKGVVFADWRDALLQADPLKRNQALAQLVAELSPGGATEALEAFMQVRREGGDFGQEMRLFMRAWGGIDGEAAVREALQDRHGDNSEQVKLAQSVLGGWAAEDPQAALAWIESRESGAQTEALALGLIDGWSVADFASAAAFAESRPRSAQRDRFIELLLRRAILSGGVPAAQSWFAGIAADEHNQVYREHAFNGVVQAMLYRDPAEAAAWIAANSDQPFVGADAVRTAADSLALKSPRSAMDWVDSLSGLGDDARRQGVGRVFDRWAMNDLNGAGEWLASNQDHGEYDRLAAKFAMRVRGEDVEAAKAWIESISNDGIRDELLAKLEQTHSFTWRLGGENVAVGFSDGAGGAGGEPVELALTPFHIRASQDLGLEASGIGGDFGLGGLVVEEDPFSASEVSYDAFITDSSKRSSHPPITGAASCTQCHRH